MWCCVTLDRDITVLDCMLLTKVSGIIRSLERLTRKAVQSCSAETKCPPFSRWHFQLHSPEWKYVNFDIDFSDVWSQVIQLTLFLHWFSKWLGADQETSHYLNHWWLVYWRMYALTRPQWVYQPIWHTYPCLSVSLGLGQSIDFPGASEVTILDMGKID